MSCTYKDENGIICGAKTNENKKTGKAYAYCLKCNRLRQKNQNESFKQAVINHIRKTQCCWIGNYPKSHFRVKCIEPIFKNDFCKIHQSEASEQSEECVPLPKFGVSQKDKKNGDKGKKINNKEKKEQLKKLLNDPVSSSDSEDSNVEIPKFEKITKSDLEDSGTGSDSEESEDVVVEIKSKKDKKDKKEKVDKKDKKDKKEKVDKKDKKEKKEKKAKK